MFNLLNSRPGFVVEGGDLTADHPLHPSNKGGVLAGAIKAMMKKPKLKKRKMPSVSDHVLPKTITTTKTMPRGSYAI